jgi:hypothetical protein
VKNVYNYTFYFLAESKKHFGSIKPQIFNTQYISILHEETIPFLKKLQRKYSAALISTTTATAATRATARATTA